MAARLSSELALPPTDMVRSIDDGLRLFPVRSGCATRSLHPEHDHLLFGHFPHRPWNSADAVTGLAAAGEGHPVGAEGRMVVDHHRRGGEMLGDIERGPQIFGEDAGLKRHG